MTKEQMVQTMANAAGITKKQAATALDAFCTAVGSAMRNGDKLTLTGFGTFEAKVREARDCKNPQTGETVRVASHKVPHFKAGKGLKDSLL
jgi:DNA-binding protein HU-beta